MLFRSSAESNSTDVGSEAWLRRYARQIVLPEVGEEGQRKWAGASVEIAGSGDAAVACAVHLAAAGVGSLTLFDSTPLEPAASRGWPLSDPGARSPAGAVAVALRARGHDVVAGESRGSSVATGHVDVEIAGRDGSTTLVSPGDGPIARARGALLADGVMRDLLRPDRAQDPIRIADDGTVSS